MSLKNSISNNKNKINSYQMVQKNIDQSLDPVTLWKSSRQAGVSGNKIFKIPDGC